MVDAIAGITTVVLILALVYFPSKWLMDLANRSSQNKAHN